MPSNEVQTQKYPYKKSEKQKETNEETNNEENHTTITLFFKRKNVPVRNVFHEKVL